MVACPFCGEKINLDARLCRHCNRAVLYSFTLTASLDEKQSHEFIRKWQSFEKKFGHLPLSHYSSAREELKNIPATLAWDLTAQQADDLIQNFGSTFFEKKFQSQLPTSHERGSLRREMTFEFSFSPTKILPYAIAAVVTFIAIYFLMPKKEKAVAIQQAQASPSAEAMYAKPATVEKHEGFAPKSFAKEQIEKILNASVFIRDQKHVGSGFFISSEGHLLSNAHVTSIMEKPVVYVRDGRQFEAQKISEDKKLDVSLLKIDFKSLEYLTLGDVNKVYPGQNVITIGNPSGLSFTITRGIVSYVGRMIQGVPYIQTDAALNRGNSGGPMINDDFEVIGINSLSSLDEKGISFALPINLVCAPKGMTEGIPTTPSTCPSLILNQNDLSPTTYLRDANTPAEPKRTEVYDYTAEAEGLKTAYEKEVRALAQEEAEIASKQNELAQRMEKNLDNLSLYQSLQPEVERLQRNFENIQLRKREAYASYLKKSIALLERQRLDQNFANHVAEIDNEIGKLRNQLKSSQGN